jgi:hypothetical protein
MRTADEINAKLDEVATQLTTNTEKKLTKERGFLFGQFFALMWAIGHEWMPSPDLTSGPRRNPRMGAHAMRAMNEYNNKFTPPRSTPPTQQSPSEPPA